MVCEFTAAQIVGPKLTRVLGQVQIYGKTCIVPLIASTAMHAGRALAETALHRIVPLLAEGHVSACAMASTCTRTTVEQREISLCNVIL